jgi:deoxyribonuclease-4
MPVMQRSRRRIGVHLALGHGMVRAADRAREIGATALQVFADNPTAWRRRAEPHRELPAFRERLGAHDLRPIAIHGSYLVNLAAPDAESRDRSIDLVISELRAAPGYGAAIVNIHAGSHREAGEAAGVEALADGVARALAEVDSGPGAARLVVENSAGGGWTIGVSIEDLARIADAVARRGVPAERFGFCLDTAHLWGGGHPIDNPEGVDALFTEVERLLGPDAVALVHLNDSKAELGSRSDRHEHLGAGRIGPAGLGHLLRHPVVAGLPVILETPGMDEGWDGVNMARALDLLADRPLEPLPEHAFTVRGSRARASGPPEEETG